MVNVCVLADWLDAVSYTHLDVYKRQLLVPYHQTTILRTQRPYFYKMTTALVEALYLKLF